MLLFIEWKGMDMNDNSINNKNPINKGFILFLSIIGIICLIVIAFCLSFDTFISYQNISKQRVTEASTLTGVAQETRLAKNTLYDDGIISIMIENIDKNASWNYFVSDTGRSVVEVKGEIPTTEIQSFIDAMDSSRVSKLFTDLKNEVAEDISKLEFHIQFIKQLGMKNDTPYNNYMVGYTEYILTDKKAKQKTITAYSSEIFDVMEAYIASKWKL